MIEYIKAKLVTAERILHDFLSCETELKEIAAISFEIANALEKGNKIIVFGNGGSMCDAMHFAEELTGRFRHDRPALPAIALSDPAFLTCTANDYGFEQVFARGIEAYAQAGDIVIGISTSGNSPNVINALKKAHELQCRTIALLGKNGGLLAGTCHHEIIIKAETTDRIQEMHIKIIHIIIECIENILFNYINQS